jgi:hypothetical protein
MPTFGPIKRRKLIAYFRQLGFDGPFPARRHEVMRRGDLSVRIPNPHQGDISRELLNDLLAQAGVTRAEWKALP